MQRLVKKLIIPLKNNLNSAIVFLFFRYGHKRGKSSGFGRVREFDRGNCKWSRGKCQSKGI